MGARGSGRRGRTEDGGGGQQPGQPVVVRLVRQGVRNAVAAGWWRPGLGCWLVEGERKRKGGPRIKQDRPGPLRFRDPWATPTNVALKSNSWGHCQPTLLLYCSASSAYRIGNMKSRILDGGMDLDERRGRGRRVESGRQRQTSTSVWSGLVCSGRTPPCTGWDRNYGSRGTDNFKLWQRQRKCTRPRR